MGGLSPWAKGVRQEMAQATTLRVPLWNPWKGCGFAPFPQALLSRFLEGLRENAGFARGHCEQCFLGGSYFVQDVQVGACRGCTFSTTATCCESTSPVRRGTEVLGTSHQILSPWRPAVHTRPAAQVGELGVDNKPLVQFAKGCWD